MLPGLIDAHTHMGHAFESIVWRDVGSLSVAEIAAEIMSNLSLALDSGITSARELGGLDGGMARAIARGLVRGPRLFPSGPALAQTGGHGTYLGQFPLADSSLSVPGLVDRAVVADGAEGVRRAARLAFRRGATQLKVYASGGVLSEGDAITDSQFSVGELEVVVEEARARGTYVTAHAPQLVCPPKLPESGYPVFRACHLPRQQDRGSHRRGRRSGRPHIDGSPCDGGARRQLGNSAVDAGTPERSGRGNGHVYRARPRARDHAWVRF